jgi:hypothetical protein
MKATWLYRTAAILFVIFATGHTIGFLKFVPPTSEGKAVMDAMNTVTLQPGAAYTFGAFYRGFGLFVTVYFLFAASVARPHQESPLRPGHPVRGFVYDVKSGKLTEVPEQRPRSSQQSA